MFLCLNTSVLFAALPKLLSPGFSQKRPAKLSHPFCSVKALKRKLSKCLIEAVYAADV
jgi:hypothetical protein